ncbi:MAG: transporter [Cyanobacteria bacterium RYN_339]|nr:transporter [Cyanobacteria bacterium RYN_339]
MIAPDYSPPVGRAPRPWLETGIAIVICLLSLVILSYAGLGEAWRTYPGLVVRSIASQGQVLQEHIDRFLATGLPVKDFPGLEAMSRTLIATNPAIARVSLEDAGGHEIFAQPPGAEPKPFGPSALHPDDKHFAVGENGDAYRVSLPLANRFGKVGALRLDLPLGQVRRAVDNVFAWVGAGAALLLLLYAAGVAWAGRRDGGRLVTWGYAAAFLAMAGVVVAALITLYSGAIQDKTRALGTSLAGRLEPAFAIGLTLQDFTGVEETFQAYKHLDPDLDYACLLKDGNYVAGTQGLAGGVAWGPSVDHFDQAVTLQGGRVLHVGVQKATVYRALWRSVKNFLVLFVALSFVAVLFFNFRKLLVERSDERVFALGAIRPLYFLAVFVEGLGSSFLPTYFGAMAADAHMPAGTVASLFTTYFLAFVAALLPAGRYAQARGPRGLVLAGTVLAGVGLAIAGSGLPFVWMYLARAVAGLGQGLLLVGVEAVILRNARADQRTQASTIIVYGYNGGMIAGGAIGALLAVYMGTRMVLVAGAAIAIANLLFGLAFMRAQGAGPASGVAAVERLGATIGQCLKDREFLRTTLLVGIPSKAVLTGVTVFAGPLLLARLGYMPEDIGQILMFYAGGVLLSSRNVARWVDRTGSENGVLIIGILGSGVGLVVLGLAGYAGGWPMLAPIVPVAGLFILGLAHGCINAPVVTHIGRTHVAERLGGPVAGSLYRFLERAGHVSGPIVVGQMLAFQRTGTLAMGWLGAGVIVAGLLFLVSGRGTEH